MAFIVITPIVLMNMTRAHHIYMMGKFVTQMTPHSFLQSFMIRNAALCLIQYLKCHSNKTGVYEVDMRLWVDQRRQRDTETDCMSFKVIMMIRVVVSLIRGGQRSSHLS